jgi:hypothetical protein
VCLAIYGQELVVRSADDELHVAAPQIHFLKGKPLELIHNGNAVPYDFQLSVLAESKSVVLRRVFDRFVFSYDLWEEKFSVMRMRGTRVQASNMSAPQAEAWCVEKMSMPLSGLPADQPLWVRLEVRSQDPHDRTATDTEGMSLKALIDLFSTASRGRQPQYWRAEAGPLKLADFRHVMTLRGAD